MFLGVSDVYFKKKHFLLEYNVHIEKYTSVQIDEFL